MEFPKVLLAFSLSLLFPIVFRCKIRYFSLNAVACFKVKHINYISILKNQL